MRIPRPASGTVEDMNWQEKCSKLTESVSALTLSSITHNKFFDGPVDANICPFWSAVNPVVVQWAATLPPRTRHQDHYPLPSDGQLKQLDGPSVSMPSTSPPILLIGWSAGQTRYPFVSATLELHYLMQTTWNSTEGPLATTRLPPSSIGKGDVTSPKINHFLFASHTSWQFFNLIFHCDKWLPWTCPALPKSSLGERCDYCPIGSFS